MPPTLPEEILVLIFKHLALPTARKVSEVADASTSELNGKAKLEQFLRSAGKDAATLHSICLASKSFCRLAQPVLFSSYMFGYRNDIKCTADPDAFLRTICVKPEMGKALRSLSVQFTQSGFMPYKEREAMATALFQWRARGLWLGEQPDSDSSGCNILPCLLPALDNGAMDGVLALLVLMCPGIRDLDIAPTSAYGTSAFARILLRISSAYFDPSPEQGAMSEPAESEYIARQIFNTSWPRQTLRKPAVLHHLHTMTVRKPGFADFRSSLRLFRNIFYLPSLRTFRVDGLRGRGPTEPTDLFPLAHQSVLQNLYIDNCRLGGSEIAAIAESCPQLRLLHVSWEPFKNFENGRDYNSMSPNWCMHFGRIGEAIAKHCLGMKSLKLDSSDSWRNGGAEPKHPFILGSSLKGLGGDLRVLTLDEHSVYGSECGKWGFSLAETVPEHVFELHLVSYGREPDDEGTEYPTAAYLQYQDDDLNAFLQDASFCRLGFVELKGRVRDYDQAAARESGWDIKTRVLGKSEGVNALHTLIRRERLDEYGLGSTVAYFDGLAEE